MAGSSLSREGGLNEILHAVREAGRDPQRALRLWVMFDSDARAGFDPDEQTPIDNNIPEQFGPSTTSRSVKRACKRAKPPICEHQLRRRAIENYAPGRILQAWARGSSDRARKVDVFLNTMTPEQRHYFNMKKGFNADKNSAQGVSPIYGDALQRSPELATGFEELATFFHEREFSIEQAWLTDGQADELEPLIKTIFERM